MKRPAQSLFSMALYFSNVFVASASASTGEEHLMPDSGGFLLRCLFINALYPGIVYLKELI